MLNSSFDPKSAEPRLYAQWEKAGAFSPKGPGPAFCMSIPPPNITGSLHIGHAFNCTLQDVLARFERLRGKAVLWQPGTDHAGIATQMVVERQLSAGGANEDRRSLGREAFIERIWQWKGESGGRILEQLRRLGASADWSRERFTLDGGLSAAVRKVFVQLHQEGLIYRDTRLVNWDPHFETAISDLEVENREVKGQMWRFAYPLADGPVDGISEIIIATTRPETMLGDGAVAVHPSDERYKNLIGRMVRLPVAERLIPIIADEYPDPEFGSGAVKITGAHDFNDFQVAKRHNIPLLRLMDTRARMCEAAPPRFHGLDRMEARARVLEEMEGLGLLRGVEERVISQPFGDRSGVVIEPMLTEQWFVDAQALAGPALAAVRDGQTRFVPESWAKTYFNWLENIEPWCISRQLWWGHRIPAWYGPNGEIFVAETEAQAHQLASAQLGGPVALRQDEDVLDTWFSSALWPFSTLGWPEETPEMARFYPNATLVTAFDIIFFWVARMMMFGLHFTGKVPFRDVYIHALVRDEKGAKMSKSKGNAMDPLDLVDRYGADALRFTLAALAVPGRDVKLSESRIEGYRNFGTKLWNAARFCQMNECANWEEFDPKGAKGVLNRWIISETVRAAGQVTQALEAYRFNDAAAHAYRFAWNVFCDWFVELAKPILNGSDEAAKAETRRTAAWVLDHILTLLHPIMPFITEELWQRLAEFGPARKSLLIEGQWPALSPDLIDEAAGAEIDWIVRLISEVRSTRSELSVPAAARIPLLLVGADAAAKQRLETYQDLIDRLARLEYSTTADALPRGAATFVLDEATIALPLQGIIDFEQEGERLKRELAKLAADRAKLEAKLGNPQFTERAPEEVVEEHKERLEEAILGGGKLQAALQRLQALG